MMAGLDRVDRWIGALLGPVVFAGMAALTGVITLQIVSRVFFTSVSWTEELARFLLIWITFLGAALAWQQGRHLVVTSFRDALPAGARRWVEGGAILVALAFLGALAWIGWRYMGLQSFQKSPSMRLPMSYVYSVMPVSAALMAVLSLIDLARLLAGRPARDGG